MALLLGRPSFRRSWFSIACASVLWAFAPHAESIAAEKPTRPNVILILADDLGYGELGCYGQTKIKTPQLDRMAREGMRFTQFYAGNAVCAPSRCVLLTGQHAGHCVVRDNFEVQPEGQFPLPKDAMTLATAVKRRGYATGAIGKWGLGATDSTGNPNRQGFDFFYGYNCQRHAHSHYPTYLWRNDAREPQPGNHGKVGATHSQDQFERETLKFLDDHAQQPFFLFLPYIIPHVALQIADEELQPYADWREKPYDGQRGYLPHPRPHAAYAAMISRLDRTVGKIFEKLKSLHLDENTLVLFTSDNGPTHGRVGGADSEFFESTAGLRGRKGSLYEGGIRVPLIARWPGRIAPGSTSDLACAAYDLFPTICQLTGGDAPRDTDGLSLVATLTGQGEQPKHEFLYWEFPGYGGQQAALLAGRYKAVRQRMRQGNLAIELHDLATDRTESHDIAAKHPDLIARAKQVFAKQHVASRDFPLPGVDAKP